MSTSSYGIGAASSRTIGPWATGASERVARYLLRLAAGRVPVDIALPDGSLLGLRSDRFPSAPAMSARPRIELIRPKSLYSRIARNPKIGIGEAYTAGEWTTGNGTDLADVLSPFAERLNAVLPGWIQRLRFLVDQPIPPDQRGSHSDTRTNVAAHYDLSNEMFAAFLDATLTYSCAIFDHDLPLVGQDLQEAQLRKIDAILESAKVGPHTRLLEIGTGWGSLAIEAARRGADVTTVTLSDEQATLARDRIAAAGLNGRIDVLVQDYRDVADCFDAIVSVEMIEAVGERHWPEFFNTLARLLRPGGTIALQSILMPHERYLATRNSYGWIQKHIFPGGLIPSTTALEQHAASAGLQISSAHHFGPDYAETLRRWRHRFLAAWPSIRSDSFGEEFRRTWEFYLAYCEAGFRANYLDVAQLRIERRPVA